MILLFGFLFVTVSSRLTGEIGSSSNPISGMTIATLLLTCLILLGLSEAGRHHAGQGDQLTALTIAGGRVHRLVQRRHHVAGPEDRLPRRGDAEVPAVRHPDRVADLGAGHRAGAAAAQPGRDGLHARRTCRRSRWTCRSSTATDHVRTGPYAERHDRVPRAQRRRRRRSSTRRSHGRQAGGRAAGPLPRRGRRVGRVPERPGGQREAERGGRRDRPEGRTSSTPRRRS